MSPRERLVHHVQALEHLEPKPQKAVDVDAIAVVIRELITKWRQQQQTWNNVHPMNYDKASTYGRCADELEAAETGRFGEGLKQTK